jgi:hypothetical protein
MHRLHSFVLLLAVLALCARATRAQEIGTIASLDGGADIGRGGTWMPAAIGAPINLGDELRTGTPGRLRIVFQDDSVITVGDDSHLVIDQQVFDPRRGTARSLIELLRGKLNALVSDYYHTAGNSYEVKTHTAVAGVRGTEFVMTYDADTDVTEVVGLSGHVEVHSMLDPTAPGVLVTAHEATTVASGRLPTPPQRVGETIFRQRLEGITFIGGGKTESLLVGNPLRAGAAVPAPERAPVAGTIARAPHHGPNDRHDASNLVGEPPAIVKATTGQLGIAFPHH